ncbi:hypothetical protein [Afipia sp. OHSU_I-C4]|uniref:hypothetical protein n=1 Tax=Afipia sp. OHSU_I-C4 TaxID=1297863 RepID=UPI00178C7049|nr:hypothetical protein [Afipia sp. OHSU_I-C4]
MTASAKVIGDIVDFRKFMDGVSALSFLYAPVVMSPGGDCAERLGQRLREVARDCQRAMRF